MRTADCRPNGAMYLVVFLYELHPRLQHVRDASLSAVEERLHAPAQLQTQTVTRQSARGDDGNIAGATHAHAPFLQTRARPRKTK